MEPKLYVYTFGNLNIKKGNENLYTGNGKLNKCWKLLLFLISKSGETISQKRLIEELNLDKNVTPKQSLRTLVYRLRKEIKEEEEFIITEEKGYRFNKESNHWIDFKRFEKLIENARNNDEDKIRHYEKALQLYNDNFLNNCTLNSSILLKKRNEYYKLYLRAVDELIDLYKEKERYEKCKKIYNKALQLYPNNIHLYLGLIDMLKKIGKPGLAKIRTEEVLSILKNTDVEIADNLKEKIADLYQIEFSKEPEEFFNNFTNHEPNIFECGPMTFTNIYQLEKKRSDREEKELFLIHYILNQNITPDKMVKAEEILRNTLHNNLRKSDVLTRWEPGYYLQLAVNISFPNMEKIIDRIENNYRDQFPPRKANLDYKLQIV